MLWSLLSFSHHMCLSIPVILFQCLMLVRLMITLNCHEVGKIPHHLPDEELLPGPVKLFVVLFQKCHLVLLGEHERRLLVGTNSMNLGQSRCSALYLYTHGRHVVNMYLCWATSHSFKLLWFLCAGLIRRVLCFAF